jgi:hypothetical protein
MEVVFVKAAEMLITEEGTQKQMSTQLSVAEPDEGMGEDPDEEPHGEPPGEEQSDEDETYGEENDDGKVEFYNLVQPSPC